MKDRDFKHEVSDREDAADAEDKAVVDDARAKKRKQRSWPRTWKKCGRHCCVTRRTSTNYRKRIERDAAKTASAPPLVSSSS